MPLDSAVYLVRSKPRYPPTSCSPIHDDVRRAFRRMWQAWGLDVDDPFQAWLAPGCRAVVKPNWVVDENPKGHSLESLVTHSSVIRHVIECCAVAMKGKGTIEIGDCPVQHCDFDRLMKRCSIEHIVNDIKSRYADLSISVSDWRLTVLERNSNRLSPYGAQLTRDAENLEDEYVLVDLGTDSFLEDIVDFSDRFRVSNYNSRLLDAHHQAGKHEYLLTRRVFGADLVINLGKLKTHQKAGLTGALKNLVGLNGHKEYLPHHIKGCYANGGDCYYQQNPLMTWRENLADRYWEHFHDLSSPKKAFYQVLMGLLRRGANLTVGDGISPGNWSGNETVWRMTLDLNHALYFGENSPKQVISIIDGIVAGEGDGPLKPSPRPYGYLIGGENPAFVDAVIARLIGYNISRVPTVHNAIYDRRSKFSSGGVDQIRATMVDEKGKERQMSLDAIPVDRLKKPRNWVHAESCGSKRGKPGVLEKDKYALEHDLECSDPEAQQSDDLQSRELEATR